MKNTLLIVAAVVTCLVFFAACGGDSSGTADSNVTAPGELPIVKEMITLSAFAPSIGWVADWETNAAYLWLEGQTNIKIEWQESSKVDAPDKLSVMFAGGEYPGIIFGAGDAGVSNQDVFKLGQEGIIIPLNDLIDEYAYWFKECVDANPSVMGAITSPDGNIYSLPAVYTDDYHMTIRCKFWINTVWLDNLGLDMPKTLDEFYAVMVAFKEQDANGNGDPNDEIPMTGAKRDNEDLAMWLMNSFIIAGGSDFGGDQTVNGYEFIVNGKVFFNANKDEFREGLKFINKCWNEGLIDVGGLTQDKEQVKPLVDRGNVSIIGGYPSHHPGNMADMSDLENGHFRQYASLPPIKGPDGNQTSPWFIDDVIRPARFMITDKCENPAAAFRWADFMFQEEYALHHKGIEGVHWERIESGENRTGLDGEPARFKYTGITPVMEDNVHWVFGPAWTHTLKGDFAIAEDEYSYEELLYRATLEYDPYKVRKYPYQVAAIPEEDSAEFIDLRRTLHTYIGESVDRFIIGDLDINSDADWDAYVEQLEQIGLERYMEILEEGFKG